MSSGSDPHLLALLRAIRLRRAAPDAAAAGAADAAAALAGQHPSSGTPTAPSPGTPAAPAVEPFPHALPPGLSRLGLSAVPAHPDIPPESAEPTAPTPPANRDPFAQALDAELIASAEPESSQSLPGTNSSPSLPGVDVSSASLPRVDSSPSLPGAHPSRPSGEGPAEPAPTDPPGSDDATPRRPVSNALLPARRTSPPDRVSPDRVSRDQALPDRVAPDPVARDQVPLGPASRPGPPSHALTRPVTGLGPNRGTGPPWPAPVRPGAGLTPSGGTGPGGGARMSVSPVPGPLPVGRPVPGSYPEAPHPARLPGGMPPLVAPRVMPPVPGAAPARPGPPLDGMNPADDAALREVQRLLGNSLSLAGGPEEVAARLRAALVQAEPRLFAALPGGPQSQCEQLAQALTWLVHNLDQPPNLVAWCSQLGAALAECGVAPQQLQLVGAALAEAMRAGMAAGGWRQDFDDAWRTTWQHAYEWIVHGQVQADYQPTVWTAVVVGHELRRDDLAVVRLRPYLPMPFRPGQYARIEVPELPRVWRPYSLAGAPRRDNVVELHVRAKTESGVSGALVRRTKTGDRVRLRRAEGAMELSDRPGRDLLLIAGDTGVAPLKALLTELAATGDPRSAVLFWGVRTLDELYDIDDIAAIARACRRATVIPVISEGPAGPYASGLVTDAVAAYGEWSGHEVYLAGPPVMLAATGRALLQLGVHPGRIHHDQPD